MPTLDAKGGHFMERDMRGANVVLLGGVMVLGGCVVVPCEGDACRSSAAAFETVRITTSDNVVVRQGRVAQVLQDCGDGITRVMDVTTFSGEVTLDGNVHAQMNSPRCVITVEAPRLTNLTHQGLGDVEVEAGLAVEELHNLSGGNVRAHSIPGSSVDILNDGLGAVRVDRVDASTVVVTQRGGGDIRVDAVRGDVLDALNSGLGSLSVGNLNALQVALTATSGGTVDASGGADVVAVTLEGLGDVYAGDLVARAATVDQRGSGDAHANARERMDIALEGLGDVYAYGHPAQVVVRGNGQGDVFLVE